MEGTAPFSETIDIDVHPKIMSRWVQKSMPLHANGALVASNNNASNYAVQKHLLLASNINLLMIALQHAAVKVTFWILEWISAWTMLSKHGVCYQGVWRPTDDG